VQIVYSPANGLEAHMLADLLRSEGIEAHIHGEGLQGAAGELPAAGLIKLLVADEHVARARRIIMTWEKSNTVEESTQSKRPAGGALIALFALLAFAGGWLAHEGWNRSEWDVTAANVTADDNKDALPDAWFFYRPDHAVYKQEFDANFDGKRDEIYRYGERNIITDADFDDDYDGRFESKATYENGRLSRIDTDLDGDGRVDVQDYYEFGAYARQELFDSKTGVLARTNFFKLGILSASEIDRDRNGHVDTELRFDQFGEVTATIARSNGSSP
jgi:hypothetical protein